MSYKLGKPLKSSARQRVSSVSFADTPSITEQEFKTQKLYKEGQMRSLDLKILDKGLEAKAWDVEATSEKINQRRVNYQIEAAKTDVTDIKLMTAEVGYDQEQAKLYIEQEKLTQLEDKLAFEQASTVQGRDMMTIQGNTRHLQIEEARLNFTQLQAGLKARYATDFDVLEGIFVD